jgi:hypothetical protein
LGFLLHKLFSWNHFFWRLHHMGKRIGETKDDVLYSSLENSFGIFRDAQGNLWKFLQRGKEKESFEIITKKIRHLV